MGGEGVRGEGGIREGKKEIDLEIFSFNIVNSLVFEA